MCDLEGMEMWFDISVVRPAGDIAALHLLCWISKGPALSRPCSEREKGSKIFKRLTQDFENVGDSVNKWTATVICYRVIEARKKEEGFSQDGKPKAVKCKALGTSGPVAPMEKVSFDSKKDFSESFLAVLCFPCNCFMISRNSRKSSKQGYLKLKHVFQLMTSSLITSTGKFHTQKKEEKNE